MSIDHEWLEDEFFGRYEVALKLDVGTADGALELTRLIRSWLDEVDPPRLGHELNTVYVVGSERKRASNA